MSPSSLTDSLAEFSELHQRAKGGKLGPADLAKYRALRDQLGHLLLAGQHVGLQPGQHPRRALRVACALPVELAFSAGTVRATMLQLSSGGFSALLVSPPRPGEQVKASLLLPAGQPLRAEARVVAVKEYLGHAGTSFAFSRLAEPEFERLEVFVFDALLEQFGEV